MYAVQSKGLVTGAGPIVSPIDVKAATDNRDSLAKTLYSRMFDWLVEKVNTSIGQDPNAVSLVGVLDIYGTSPYPPSHLFCSSFPPSADLVCHRVPSQCMTHASSRRSLVQHHTKSFSAVRHDDIGRSLAIHVH